MKSRPHDGAMAVMNRDDPAFAVEVINCILGDGGQAQLLSVLRQMAQFLMAGRTGSFEPDSTLSHAFQQGQPGTL